MLYREKNKLEKIYTQSVFSETAYSAGGQRLEWIEHDLAKQKLYAKVLVAMLIKALSGNEVFLAIYLDERLRFAPHKSSKKIRAQYFNTLLETERDIFLSLFGSAHSSHQLWSDIKQLNSPLFKINDDDIKVLLIGDCLMNEVRVFLPHEFAKLGVTSDSRCHYLSSSDIFTEIDEIVFLLKSEKMDYLALSLFSFTASKRYANYLRQLDKISNSQFNEAVNDIALEAFNFLSLIRKNTSLPILFHNISGLPISRKKIYIPFIKPIQDVTLKFILAINEQLSTIISNFDNVILIDEYKLSTAIGQKKLSKPALPKKYHRFAHTSYFGKYLSKDYATVIASLEKLKGRKAICVDFDNTLWAGVMADGPVSHFPAKQKLLLELKDLGILLIALSKNDMKNIRWEEMLLSQDDFVDLRVNWLPKSQNINAAASRLNISSDSFIFIDDNKMELELVSNSFPNILCIDATESESWDLLQLAKQAPCSAKTEEAARRTDMYKSQSERNSVVESGKVEGKLSESFAVLQLSMAFSSGSKKNLARMEEIINRTNQFNTTTKRLRKSELVGFINSKSHRVYLAGLSDKFGDLGIVATTVVRIENNVAYIDVFVMSCRAMGYDFEYSFLHQVVKELIVLGVTLVIGRIVATDRNQPCQNLYKRAGFILEDDLWKMNIDRDFSDFSAKWIGNTSKKPH